MARQGHEGIGRGSIDYSGGRIRAQISSGRKRICYRNGAKLAGPCAAGICLASPFLAQYGMAEEKSVVRGGFTAFHEDAGARGAE